MIFIAHHRETDLQVQTVAQHLSETGELCSGFAKKIGLEQTGLILGLLHDFGKYSQAFQHYIQSAQGLIDPDNVCFVDAKANKGKIDHATAGAQYLYEALKNYGGQGQGELCGQLLALCIASHHSGLIDVLAADFNKGNIFNTRIQKPEDKAHLQECRNNAEPEIINHLNQLLKPAEGTPQLLKELLQKIFPLLGSSHETANTTINSFNVGFLTRFLFSCLIDADRLNSAEFSEPRRLQERLSRSVKPDWDIAITRLENKLATFSVRNPIDTIRQNISLDCLKKAKEKQGIYSLTVPTGGGKTYASLRYALHHAKQHQCEHIFYIIPFTSIIEQNAQVIREAIEQPNDTHPWVLEHHSSIEPEHQTWHSKICAENWGAPIVITTMVQFLEALFSGGTKSVRRLHQLANSVLVFDEIQTLPINCTHLFCNALNFLVEQASSTALLCTATQPLLNQLDNIEKGQLTLTGELVSDINALFNDLKRVHIENCCKPSGWSLNEIATLAIEQFELTGSCLTIVNTKQWAQDLYLVCQNKIDTDALFHLSTNQCPAHRKVILATIRQRLENHQPVMCFSTQLIEAGVDIDFASVIRFLAGLDSIAQAAGRCNRNGIHETATVFVVNPDHENTKMLADIDKGKAITDRIMNEGFEDLLDPAAMARYFYYYFFQRSEDMDYPCKDSQKNTTSLLALLSNNKSHPCSLNDDRSKQRKLPRLEQSFMEAGNIFKAIDAPTQAVIVDYQSSNELSNDQLTAEEIIIALCSKDKVFDAELYFQALKQAQKYSVNVFPNVFEKLLKNQAIYETQSGSGIYCLHEQYYDDAFGLSTEVVNSSHFYGC
ncbi:CRISPR-associated helicase/endonuclease Cas3 [Photobacterium aquimaris]|uniref:CRISPR-associated helicase/endonuclease Cas3 n=1 Tax=Photobacterium aquimaris TaxID=512643 RepID=A0A2T3IFS6_9GAMM|nr:CRISPR-associated helicase/endonuclease Cas3 [Photobacterium aquimaris]PSU25156.1 CRISPR-associated helicase/endonuclease Cas3 [Photobacterium aquimaris]